jgi:hypothetical protein
LKSTTAWNVAITASVLALLSLLSRTFIDYHVVYAEVGAADSLGILTLINLAFFGGWIWALVSAARMGRRAMFVLLGYDVLLVLFGLVTVTSLCPLPCHTLWPLGSISIVSNLVIGIPAVVLVWRSLRRSPNPVT